MKAVAVEPSVDLYKRLARPWRRTSQTVSRSLAGPLQDAQRKGVIEACKGGVVKGMLEHCEGEPFKHEVSWGLVSFSDQIHHL